MLTSLSRFVDGFISLDDVDEGSWLNEDFGLLAHRGALTRQSDIDSCHSFSGHDWDLEYQPTQIHQRGPEEERREPVRTVLQSPLNMVCKCVWSAIISGKQI